MAVASLENGERPELSIIGVSIFLKYGNLESCSEKMSSIIATVHRGFILVWKPDRYVRFGSEAVIELTLASRQDLARRRWGLHV